MNVMKQCNVCVRLNLLPLLENSKWSTVLA
jgi:hypothetical protein